MKQIHYKAYHYAKRSIGYTYEFNGFESHDQDGEKKKLERIIVGMLGQYWVYEVCRLNNIPFLEDYSNSTETDEMDVIVCNYSCDIKTSRNGVTPPQVSSHLRHVKNRPDYYIFLKTSSYKLGGAMIIPLGIITYQDFWNNCMSVPKGKKIPGTNIDNLFAETNVIDESRLHPFDDAIRNLYLRCVLNPYLPILEKKMDTHNRMLKSFAEGILLILDQLKDK